MTFDELYQTLEQPARDAMDAHVAGLKTALEKEREQRRNAEKQMKDATEQAKQIETVSSEKAKLQGELDAAKALVETNNREVGRLTRTLLLRDVADTERVKPLVLATLDGQGKYEFELREVAEGETKRKRAFVRNGDADFVVFDKFVDGQWADFKPALYPQASDVKQEPAKVPAKDFVPQGTGGAPKPPQPPTVEELASKNRKLSEYNGF